MSDAYVWIDPARRSGEPCIAAVAVVGCIAALGWRPVVGDHTPERGVVTREAQGGVL